MFFKTQGFSSLTLESNAQNVSDFLTACAFLIVGISRFRVTRSSSENSIFNLRIMVLLLLSGALLASQSIYPSSTQTGELMKTLANARYYSADFAAFFRYILEESFRDRMVFECLYCFANFCIILTMALNSGMFRFTNSMAKEFTKGPSLEEQIEAYKNLPKRNKPAVDRSRKPSSKFSGERNSVDDSDTDGNTTPRSSVGSPKEGYVSPRYKRMHSSSDPSGKKSPDASSAHPSSSQPDTALYDPFNSFQKLVFSVSTIFAIAAVFSLLALQTSGSNRLSLLDILQTKALGERHGLMSFLAWSAILETPSMWLEHDEKTGRSQLTWWAHALAFHSMSLIALKFAMDFNTFSGVDWNNLQGFFDLISLITDNISGATVSSKAYGIVLYAQLAKLVFGFFPRYVASCRKTFVAMISCTLLFVFLPIILMKAGVSEPSRVYFGYLPMMLTLVVQTMCIISGGPLGIASLFFAMSGFTKIYLL